MTKIHLVSDLHLEFDLRRTIPFEEKADYLLVAGDTIPAIYLQEHRTDKRSRLAQRAFLEHVQGMLDSYEFVIFIMGNHEHYHGVIDLSQSIMANFLARHGIPKDRVVVLENDVIELKPNVKLFAASLWTDMFSDDPNAHLAVSNYMNDYRLICREDGSILRTSHTMNLHKRSMALLRAELELYPDHEFLVMTHHCPSSQCTESGYRVDLTSAGYYSNLDEFIMDNPNIKNWVCGHTHHKFDVQVGECRVVSNPLGYPPQLSGRNSETYRNFKSHEVEIEI